MESMECYNVDDMYRGKAKPTANFSWLRPLSETYAEEKELKEQSSQALASVANPLEKLRLLCLSHGACGIMRLGRIFRIFYGVDDKQLNEVEFLTVLKKTGLSEFSEEDAKKLFKSLQDESGFISLNEFMTKIRAPMSDSRKAKVDEAFNKLDKNGEGVIDVQDIPSVYAFTANQRYTPGEEPTGRIMKKYLVNFEQEDVNGKVTREEFMNYYNGLSVSIDNDCYFDLLICQAFKL